MDTNILAKSLFEIGLDRIEVEMYLLLVHNPQITITDICKSLGINRVRGYEILEELHTRDLIILTKDKRTKIKIQPPSKILDTLKINEGRTRRIASELGGILPDLMTGIYGKERLPYLKVYSGQYQLVDLFETILDETQGDLPLLSFGEDEDFYRLFGQGYFEDWIIRRVKMGLRAKVIARSGTEFAHSQSKHDHKLLREMKFLDSGTPIYHGYFTVAGNRVIVWNMLTTEAIVIHNLMISQFFRGIFDTMWRSCR
jgi:sugar-specific transcriptional regulator TrmB